MSNWKQKWEKKRNKQQALPQQTVRLAQAFREAKEAGKDEHFLALGPSSVTAMWTGTESRKCVEEMMTALTGRPVDLTGKEMLNWAARTEEERALVQAMREAQNG